MGPENLLTVRLKDYKRRQDNTYNVSSGPQPHLFRLRIQGVLYIALSNDPQMLGHLDSCPSKELVLSVIQCLARSHHYGLPSVDAQWV